MQILESKLQSKIKTYLIKKGWFVRKILSTNCPGDPDLYCYKLGRTIWIETKREGLKARALQSYRHREIKQAGMECYVIDCWELFMMVNLDIK